MTEPRRVFLGALDVEQGQSLTLNVPLDASVEDIQAAIERANIERAEAAKKETEALAKLFQLPDQTKVGLS